MIGDSPVGAVGHHAVQMSPRHRKYRLHDQVSILENKFKWESRKLTS